MHSSQLNVFSLFFLSYLGKKTQVSDSNSTPSGRFLLRGRRVRVLPGRLTRPSLISAKCTICQTRNSRHWETRLFVLSWSCSCSNSLQSPISQCPNFNLSSPTSFKREIQHYRQHKNSKQEEVHRGRRDGYHKFILHSPPVSYAAKHCRMWGVP